MFLHFLHKCIWIKSPRVEKRWIRLAVTSLGIRQSSSISPKLIPPKCFSSVLSIARSQESWKTNTPLLFPYNRHVPIQVFIVAYFDWRHINVWSFKLQYDFSAWIMNTKFLHRTSSNSVILLGITIEVIMFPCHFHSSFT